MLCNSGKMDINLICIIAKYGSGSKLLHAAKKCGVHGGTILLGRGTVNNRICKFLGLSDERKEVVLMVADTATADCALEKLNKDCELDKPDHGIAFTTSICATFGTRNYVFDNIKELRSVDNTMYHAITIIVDKGKAEEVIDAASKAGSKGGTIINARGSGIHETSKLFSMEIEPEKELVIILSEVAMTEKIVSSIKEELKIDEPGNGIIYVQNVNKTYGIYK